MNFFIRKMTEHFAVEILNWKYEAPYDFYNNDLCTENIKELLEQTYYAVVNENDFLIGFFCIGSSAQVPIGLEYGAYSDGYIDIGLGMKPELTGKGYGYSYFSYLLQYIRETYTDNNVRLTVAKFNQRAIRLYEKLGFERKIEFVNNSTIFITMIKE
ncbi:GNAT family N-acetyltransferase [Cytobacillus praedii]|uniref:N-acetyltransferase n=1 Tax=Cytobacillus praedii TaxID=1742358 RepID=A0A4R1APY7_9BACI|nr:GNAT family N-acetyltransferase [Cytobacillus praedii]TCJ01527.1 N-acetyltransferase [Cytobacillus praedii]